MESFLLFSEMKENSKISRTNDVFSIYYLDLVPTLALIFKIQTHHFQSSYRLPGEGFVCFDVDVQSFLHEKCIAKIVVVLPNFAMSRE
jgi:hypothetical protein